MKTIQIFYFKKYGWVPELSCGADLNTVSVDKKGSEVFVRGEGRKKLKPSNIKAIQINYQKYYSLAELKEVHERYGDSVCMCFIENNAASWKYDVLRVISRKSKEVLDILQTIADDLKIPAQTFVYRVHTISGFYFETINSPYLDEEFSSNDPEYDGVKCEYKGQDCSLADYMKKKYPGSEILIP